MGMPDIIQHYQDQFNEQYATRITRQQSSAMSAVLDCRSARYGSMSLDCSTCDLSSLSFHSCGNRNCHNCQHHDTTEWLERQSQKLLPVEYFMVTFTLPRELRSWLWHHQKTGYNHLLDCAKSTLSTFAKNDARLGANTGMTAVLHTHSRRLDYHPHVHVIVPAVCVNAQRNQCTKLRGQYLFNAFALAKVFRGRFLAAIKASGFDSPTDTPEKWVVDCRHVGKGLPALQYLSRYLYRGVISDKNILADDGKQVTFGYVESKTNRYKTRTVDGAAFLWLVYQHALPKGFRRVRDYGFLNGNAKATLQRIQIALNVFVVKQPPKPRPDYLCRACGSPMRITAFRPPAWRSG